MTTPLFLFRNLAARPWWRALDALGDALAHEHAREHADLAGYYQQLYAALTDHAVPDLASAAAIDLLGLESPLSQLLMGTDEAVPNGLEMGARRDLTRMMTLLRRDWQFEVSRVLDDVLPPLHALAVSDPPYDVAELRGLLVGERGEGAADEVGPDAVDAVLGWLAERYRRHGAGPLARFAAFRWDGTLRPVVYPVRVGLERLVGLDRPLNRLVDNTEALLAGRPAQHALLYGPRGSGKSTAVKGLLTRYHARGLRLVELPTAALVDLPDVLDTLRPRPHRYILFVDDLSFEPGDSRYAPLKTLLEGSLSDRPGNVVVYATSNRRHLVSEQFSDRPGLYDDDVHGGDTQNERLALADRFGLTLTFPNASQQRYLEIVRGLAETENLLLDDLDERAIRYAEWGNGYSGRTAQQFIDTLKASSV
ncbi:MAG: ATP-binding protein [Trueperaceae bacterium]|nr:ATP-binding protein [Trueperaceae bacterium]